MRRNATSQTTVLPRRKAHKLLERRLRVSLLLSALPALLFALPAAPAISQSHKTVIPGKRVQEQRRLVTAHPPKPAPAPAAQEPKWPINHPPAPASVVWNDHHLRIEAKNSSLRQILDEVSSKTGAQIDGLGPDQRVFGVFGPGQPRAVLTQLLEGTGYNVIIVGDQAKGVPLRIQLSARPKGGPEPNAPVSPSEEVMPMRRQPIQPPRPRPTRPPNAKNNPNSRTPQQVLRQMQQREQQIREEQMRLEQMRKKNNQQ